MTRNEALRYILNYAVDEVKLGLGNSKRTFTHRSATIYACNKLYSEIKMNPDKSVFFIAEHFAKRMERIAENIPYDRKKVMNFYMSTVAMTAQDLLDGLYIYDQTPLEGKIHG